MKKFFAAALTVVMAASVSFSASAQEKNSQDKGFWFDVAASAGGMITRNPAGTAAKYGMNRASYGVEAVFGYRFNNYVALGAGAQFVGEINRSDVSVPIIARVRYDILDRMVCPFLAVDLGYSVYPYKTSSQYGREGLIGSGTIGVAIKSDGNHRAYLGIVGSAVQVYNPGASWIRTFRPELRIKIGYEF
ncbi:MAG: hypothetical protein ACI39U_06510 [Candidatus Cryptobacteroides sp.]